jgi:hypothetical protein
VSRTAVVLTLGAALILAALAGGAWELRRLDQDVQALRTDVEGDARTESRADSALKSLANQATELKDSSVRQEFYEPLYAYATQIVVAVETGYTECGEAKQTWQKYVNDKVITHLNKPENREVKLALRRNDPNYHAPLLNAISLPC